MEKITFKLHPFFLITAFLCLILGYFRFFITFTLIILFHECGHILMMLIYKWDIKKIILLPFGGLTICNVNINTPLKEEMLVALMGPIFQIIYSILFKNNLVLNIHYTLLFFNLLPIYPLDGYKILTVFLNIIRPFYFTLIISLLISLTILLILPFFYIVLWFILILLILLFQNIKIIKNYKLIWYRFLYERVNYNIKYSKIKVIKNIQNMFKDTFHFIEKNGIITDEKKYLRGKW